MAHFVELLGQEQAAIHAALERAVARLPQSVREVSSYVLLGAGKRLRPMLTLISSRLYGHNPPEVYDLAAVLEMVHVASLLHDDVLDDAHTRRGKRSAHLAFGVSPCLLAGDALLASASYHVSSYGDTKMVDTISEAMMITVAGEAHEIAIKGSLEHDLPTYLDIASEKTGWLLRAACRLGAQFANASPSDVQTISDFGLNAGIAFQIVDDALDFADESITGKPTGGDLREGKLTPPIMFYRDTLGTHGSPERTAFAQKFAQSQFSDEEINTIAHAIRKQGRATLDLADTYLAKAETNLAALPDKPERDLLREVLTFVRDRRA